jgi:hypothetical protein
MVLSMTSQETREDEVLASWKAATDSLYTDPYSRIEALFNAGQDTAARLRVVLKERDEAQVVVEEHAQVVSDLEDRLLRAEEALREITGTATDLPHARRLDREAMRRIARAYFAAVSEEDTHR